MKYFGTDGIRGRAFEDITEAMAYAVGRSLGILEKEKVIVCRDTRASGKQLARALKHGVIDAGLEAWDIDILATPILAYLTQIHDCYGVMITASHNPYMDNGIKVFNRGHKTNPKEEAIIEDVIDQKTILEKRSGGREVMIDNAIHQYFNLYKAFIGKSSMNIALDLANGAAIKSAKYVFNQMSDQVSFIGDCPNGENINDGVGSTHMDQLVNFVVTNKCDIGFAFDGDGDRVLAVDHTGQIVDGDQLIYCMASYLQSQERLNNQLVVLTKMSNLGIIDALDKRGIDVIQTDVGDKYVMEAMKAKAATIGGENSGHIINRDLFISGDGVLNAAYLVSILEKQKTSLHDLIKDIQFYPDKLVNLRGYDKAIVKDPTLKQLVSSIEAELKGKGKILVRASGTEALIRISVQAKTESMVDEIIDRVIRTIEEIAQERTSK